VLARLSSPSAVIEHHVAGRLGVVVQGIEDRAVLRLAELLRAI
jgi:hypothetical protein